MSHKLVGNLVLDFSVGKPEVFVVVSGLELVGNVPRLYIKEVTINGIQLPVPPEVCTGDVFKVNAP